MSKFFNRLPNDGNAMLATRRACSKIKPLTNKQLWRIWKVISELDEIYSNRVEQGAKRQKRLETEMNWAQSIILKKRA